MPIPRRYGVSDTVYFPMIKRGVVDFASGSADWIPANGDTLLTLDGASRSYATNLPTASGAAWVLTLTAGELTGKKLNVLIVDAATKAVEDQMLLIETYGNVAAQQGFDFTVSTITLSAPANTDIADALLGRNVAGGSSTGRTVKQAFYVLRNKVEASGTVYETDDTTPAWTFTVATTSDTTRIVTVDPS